MLNGSQHLASISTGKVEVEQDQARPGGWGRLTVHPTPIQEVQGVIAVSTVEDRIQQARFPQSPHCGFVIFRTILDDED
jgi:hypothetical protein